jgi:LysM repeat protein
LKKVLLSLILVGSLFVMTGCILTLAMGAASGIKEIIKYSADNIAEKTFTGNAYVVASAAKAALENMNFKVKNIEMSDDNHKIYASTKELNIEMTLKSISANSTKVTVDTNKYYLFKKDKATGDEIISQIQIILTEKTKHKNQLIAYKVKPGDSPFKIAKRYKMNLNKLLLINSLTKKSIIYPGQRLFIEPNMF